MKLRTDRNCHAKYNLQYHLILVTKYRNCCINEAVFQTIQYQFERVAKAYGVEIEEIAYEADHIHALISVPPQVELAKLINSFKSTSSRRVRKEHREYLDSFYWRPVFWSRSYMILSSGGAPIDVIREYIREQGTEEHSKKKKTKKKSGWTPPNT